MNSETVSDNTETNNQTNLVTVERENSIAASTHFKGKSLFDVVDYVAKCRISDEESELENFSEIVVEAESLVETYGLEQNVIDRIFELEEGENEEKTVVLTPTETSAEKVELHRAEIKKSAIVFQMRTHLFGKTTNSQIQDGLTDFAIQEISKFSISEKVEQNTLNADSANPDVFSQKFPLDEAAKLRLKQYALAYRIVDAFIQKRDEWRARTDDLYEEYFDSATTENLSMLHARIAISREQAEHFARAVEFAESLIEVK